MIKELNQLEEDMIGAGGNFFEDLGYAVGSVVEAFVEGVAAALRD